MKFCLNVRITYVQKKQKHKISHNIYLQIISEIYFEKIDI